MKSFPLPDVCAAHRSLRNLAARIPNVVLHRVERPLVLYGAGHLGRMAAGLLQQLDIPIAYALDRSPPLDGLLLGRIPVLTPEQAPLAHRNSHQVAVCVVTAPYKPIYTDLANMGWQRVNPVYDILEAYTGRLPMGNGWFAGALDDEDVGRIEQVLACWHDDHSRAAHLQFLAWRVHREEWHFSDAPVCIDDRYFIPEVLAALEPEECFLDAGAWHGVVSQRFLAKVGGHLQAILAVEADRLNFQRLQAWATGLPLEMRDRVRLLDCALGEMDGELTFTHGHDMASRLMELGQDKVTVRSLDSLDLAFSFVKLHLEGGELAALRGARRSLLKHRPLLAVTVYHNRDGLWPTAAWLMDHLSGYHFLFRLHSWCGTGAVLYGLPQERMS